MPPTINVTQNAIDIQSILDGTRPEYWFPTIFKYAPLGVKNRAMMTLMASKASERRVDDKLFHFFQKPWNQRDCAVVDVYNGPGLTTATSAGGSAGDTRVIAMTAANTKLWQVGQQILVTKFNESGAIKVVAQALGKITGKEVGGDTTSYVTVVLQRDDTDNALSGAYLKANPAGQSHPDVHTLPESNLEQSTKYDGACSTFLGSYSMNDTVRMTKLRVETEQSPSYLWAEAREDGLKEFAIDVENAFRHSWLKTGVPDELVTGGYEYYLKTFQAQTGQNIIDASSDTVYLPSSITGPAHTWIYELLEAVMEYASHWSDTRELSAFHGGQAGIVINQMIRDKGVYNLGETTGVDEFGFEFSRLKFQNGSIKFYPHPLYTNAPADAGRITIPNFENITTCVFSPFEMINADSFNESGRKRDGNTWSSVAKGGFREMKGWKFNAIDSMFDISNVHPQISRS